MIQAARAVNDGRLPRDKLPTLIIATGKSTASWLGELNRKTGNTYRLALGANEGATGDYHGFRPRRRRLSGSVEAGRNTFR